MRISSVCKKNALCLYEICYSCYQTQQSFENCPEEFKRLYAIARPKEIRIQLKKIYPEWNDDKIEEIGRKRDNEIEHGTPYLNGYQSFQWPCIDGDYAEFIAYGSKTFYNSFFDNGKESFYNSIHIEMKDCLYDEYWEERVPDETIDSSKDTNYSTLFFVFKSLTSEKFITYIDSM